MSLSGNKYSTTTTKEEKVSNEILKLCTCITIKGKYKHDDNENCVISTLTSPSEINELSSEISSPGQEHICEVTSKSKHFLPTCVLNRNSEQPELWTANLKFKTCCEEKEYYRLQDMKKQKMMETKKEKKKEEKKKEKEIEIQNQMIEKHKVMEWSEVIEMQRKHANIPKPDIDISSCLITPVFFSNIRAIEQQWLEETISKSKSTTTTVTKKISPGDEEQLKGAIASILPKD